MSTEKTPQNSSLNLHFDRLVPNNGYAWWYADGISDDHQHAITLIAFIGSVFSPYYAWARRGSDADPMNYCALNIAIYSPGQSRWAMTERSASSVQRSADYLHIGPSQVRYDGQQLRFNFNETGCPIPRAVQGEVTLSAGPVFHQRYALDNHERHWWRPIAPTATISVNLDSPDLQWTGTGYIDTNFGSEPLESAFEKWVWMRTQVEQGTQVHYMTDLIDGSTVQHGMQFDHSGKVAAIDTPSPIDLKQSGWRINQPVPCQRDERVELLNRLEDTPFYSRSLLKFTNSAQSAHAIHESLSLSRFRQPIVQAMLPFRMPRTR